MLALVRTSVLAFIASQPRNTLISLRSKSCAPLSATKYLLRYDYVSDVLEKRGPYREDHLNLAKEKCVSGGPTKNPDSGVDVPTGALFIFSNLESLEEFVKEDPYVHHGIVTKHYIDEWNVVVQNEE